MPPLLDYLFHIGTHLEDLIRQYGQQTHAILFGIIFAETGFVVTPFLPGDSLLFAAGLFARPGKGLNVWLLLLGLPIAAMLGDLVNFHLGKYFGKALFRSDDARFFKKSHLNKTKEFFARHGTKTIILCRFVPVVRALAPFCAGMEGMSRKTFIPLSAFSAFLWVWLCVGSGYILGAIPFVKSHFEEIILGIVVISLLVILFELIRDRVAHKKKQPDDGTG